MSEPTQTEIDRIMKDPSASHWLKSSLRSMAQRDPVDAANDVDVLSQLAYSRLVESCHKHLSPEELRQLGIGSDVIPGLER